ncbi:MAG: hypothetical protein A2W99_06715 [Bacteroidetes bacterium GWF2_33_16]|nr:MAG: hypothetical protein A2X00_12150 [Bacteroidetes bacterium GWE2_32_14]OFY04386.1 MAG: hypothetical protein A2W99_06715 [Bacteroidetes bacterium GWF2_33_16]
MKVLLKILKYILITTLILFLLIGIIGLIHHFTSPGMKSISLLDLKQLGLLISGNLVLLFLIVLVTRRLKK